MYKPFKDGLERSAAFDQLDSLMKERILFIDGAMGTQIQKWKLEESDFRGDRYTDHSDELKGNNDLLVITRPDVIESIHNAFLEAGADIIETNTFNGTTISQADYALDQKEEVDLINTTAARLAKKCTAAYMAANPGSVKFVAGAIGPTNKTLSVSPSVENPALRGITFDEVAQAYYEQAVALPAVTALLVANVMLGVITRSAPQLNLFAFGLPVTTALGMVLLLVTLPYLEGAVASSLNAVLAVLGRVLG